MGQAVQRYYVGFKLTSDLESLSKYYNNLNNKLYAASVYARSGRYTFTDIQKMTGVKRQTLHDFIHKNLNDISPDMYNRCLDVIEDHKKYGSKSVNDAWLEGWWKSK